MLLLLFFTFSTVFACSPGTPFYPKQWVERLNEELAKVISTTEGPDLPTPEALIALTQGIEEKTSESVPEVETKQGQLTWRQISAQQNFRPVADSFTDIYRRLEQQNMQHLMAVEPEGQRPSWP